MADVTDVAPARRRWAAERLPRLIVVAIVVGLGIGHLYWAVTDWSLPDAAAYWEAALRLRSGEPLYPPVTDVDASEVYRYAPWFAWAAVPVSFLPVEIAGAAWSVVLVAASSAAVLPLVRRGSWLAVAFFWPMLIGISAIGNVQPLLVAALTLGLERRGGPLWIAVAASLKFVPILFVLVYLGRREWGRAALAIGLTGVLLAPIVAYDLTHYVIDAGSARALSAVPPLWLAAVALSVVATIWLARTSYGWLAAGATAVIALPRLFVYHVTFLLPGTLPLTEPASPHGSQSGRRSTWRSSP